MKHVDVHCHFFNLQYGFRELLVIAWDMFLKRYPRGSGREKDVPFARDWEPPGWLKFLKYIASLAGAATRPCSRQYRFEQSQYQESTLSNGEGDIVTVPLMMDIYYIFSRDDADVTDKRGFDGAREEGIPSPEIREEFKAFAAVEKERVLKEISLIGYDAIAALNSDYTALELENSITEELQRVIDEFFDEDPTDLEQDTPQAWLSRGYRKHMRDLEKLKRNEPETVKPFLAVDPRRQDIVELLKKKVGRSEEKTFKGVKLYPGLGYLPTHPNLFPVYDFCIESDIPICVHTSDGGLPSLAGRIYVRSEGADGDWFEWDIKTESDKPSKYFGAPEKWIPVLEADSGQYRNLRINFAHFGKEKPAPGDNEEPAFPAWRKQIVELMKSYENVYADLSYCHDNLSIGVINDIVREFPVVAERLMFGTDYIMIMTDRNLGGLKNYFDRFVGLSDEMLYDNARRFLGLGQPTL